MSSTPPLRPYVANNLIWAILSTLFCCLPLGIVSIVYAAQVDGKAASGDTEGARESARKASYWAIASALALPVVLVLWFFVFGGLALLAGLSEM